MVESCGGGAGDGPGAPDGAAEYGVVHKLICEGTIEERILELQQRKSALVAGLLDASAPAVALTAEDLEMLLSPIG